jgi:hypothetical protein
MRASTTLTGWLAVAILCGCQTIEYGPMDGKPRARYAYREKLVSEGHYVLTLVGNAGGGPEMMHAMWERRAGELCTGGYEMKIFKAERPTTTYGYYGGAPGAPILEGFLDCKGAPGPGVATHS